MAQPISVQEAEKILGVTADASPEAIDRKLREGRDSLNKKAARTLSEDVKAKIQASLRQLDEAAAVLRSANSLTDLPIASPWNGAEAGSKRSDDAASNADLPVRTPVPGAGGDRRKPFDGMPDPTYVPPRASVSGF